MRRFLIMTWLCAACTPCVRARDLRPWDDTRWKLLINVAGDVYFQTPATAKGEWHFVFPRERLFVKNPDRVRTGDDSRARVVLGDLSSITMGSRTVLELARVYTPPHKVFMAKVRLQSGYVHSKVLKFLRGESSFDVETRPALLGTRGTTYIVAQLQRIAYVQGGDLWLMDETGANRTNLLAAPPGGRIGRCAFSPDGSRIAYEVWTLAAGEPQTIDLWTANGDGSGAHLLAAAGTVTEDDGVDGYRYTRRWCAGPSISPDGQSVSFLRINDHVSEHLSWYTLREKAVCRMPIGGGSATPLFETTDRAGHFSYMDMGTTTEWRPDGRIYFTRSGAVGARICLSCDASNTNLTTWPATLYAEYNDEMGLAPNRLSLSIGSQTREFSGLFYGYGNWEVRPNFEWVWMPHPAPWRSPRMGAWFGPLTVPLSQTNLTSLTAGDGQSTVNVPPSPMIIRKGQTNLMDYAGSQAARSETTGLWAIPESGGTPVRLFQHLLDSFAWSPDGQWVASEYESSSHTYGVLDNNQGGNSGDQDLGPGEWSSIGNWDDTGTRVTYWIGTNASSGRMATVSPETGSIDDLGAGLFPVFAPSRRIEVLVFEGTVAVTDTNSQHEILVSAGQRAVVDEREAQGWPQPAQAIAAPYVTNTYPVPGSLVPATGRVSVVFQFTQPVQTQSVAPRVIRGTSWPVTEAPGSAPDALIDTTVEAAMLQEGSGRSFDMALSDLPASGAGTVTWNAGRTELTVTLPHRAAFPLDAGNWARVTLDLGGVSNDAGQSLAFNVAETFFQPVNPVDASGAELQSSALGLYLAIPPGALSQRTPVTVSGSLSIPAGSESPTQAGWIALGGVIVVAPTGATLATSGVLVLPVKDNLPGAAVWAFNGAAWTNLGGIHDMTTATIQVNVSSFGTFGVFHPSPQGAALTLTKGVEPTLVQTNGEVQFALRVWNGGRMAATNTIVTDVLPPGMDYVAGSARPPANWIPATRTLAWSVGTLPSGEARHLVWDALLGPSITPGAVLTNTAWATANGLPATNSNPAVVRCSPPATERHLGAGSTNSPEVAATAMLGVGVRRGVLTITKAQAEDANPLSFAEFDAQIRTNQATGLETHGIVNAQPTTGVWPEATAFSQAFREAVERYDGDGTNDMPGLILPVRAWELFDGFAPDSNAWAGCTLEMYDQYLLLASATAHAADPEVTILPSAVDGPPRPGATNLLEQLLAYDPAILDAIDAFSVHEGWAQTAFAATSGVPVVQYWEAAALNALAAEQGRPVWLTSVDFTATYQDELARRGYTCTQADQALFMARSLPFALAAGIDRVYVAEVNTRPADTAARQWSALIDTNGNRRMAYYTLQKLAGWVTTFTSARLAPLGSTTLLAEFVGTNAQTARIVWDVSNRVQTVTLPVGPVAQARVTPLLPATWNNVTAGWNVRTQAVNNGLLTLTVSGTPVCVEAIGLVDPDLDGDGVPNAQDDDADGDGLPSEYEAAHGLNPFVADAGADADGDGLSNAAEYAAGTDPQRNDSLLRIEAVRGTGPEVHLDWTAVSGRVYRVAWSRQMDAAWSNSLDGAQSATGTVMRWTDAGPPRTPSAPHAATNRFYRVLLEPAP